MKRHVFALLLAAVLPAAAAPPDDALSLVPPDASAAGVVHVTDLRTSPLFDRVFSEMDRISCDAEAARFLSEAGLNPRNDIDRIVFAGAPATNGTGWGFVAFEGRFDARKLASATAARGATLASTGWGDYFLLPERPMHGARRGPGAIAFVSNRLIVAGSETAVAQALARRASGGDGFAAGKGLAQELSRVDPKASTWLLVDRARLPAKERAAGRNMDSPAAAVVSAMKTVSLAAFSAAVEGDGLRLSATGVSADPEARRDLADAVRGVLAMWRMAVQEKNPELVPVLRAFRVTEEKDSVTISGTLTGSAIRELQTRTLQTEK